MQKRITTPGPLHDEQGHLIETGYATELIKTYDRKRVKARRIRIKESAFRLPQGRTSILIRRKLLL